MKAKVTLSVSKTIEMGDATEEDIMEMVSDGVYDFFGNVAIESGIVIEKLESNDDDEDDA